MLRFPKDFFLTMISIIYLHLSSAGIYVCVIFQVCCKTHKRDYLFFFLEMKL